MNYPVTTFSVTKLDLSILSSVLSNAFKRSRDQEREREKKSDEETEEERYSLTFNSEGNIIELGK